MKERSRKRWITIGIVLVFASAGIILPRLRVKAEPSAKFTATVEQAYDSGEIKVLDSTGSDVTESFLADHRQAYLNQDYASIYRDCIGTYTFSADSLNN